MQPPARMILVGVDFSPPAATALGQARSLAQALGAELDLVHVVEARADVDWRGDAASLAWLRVAGMEPDAVTDRFGLPWVELARRAQERNPALVIVGSHGRSGYQPVALGSTAGRLAVVSPVPVMIVSARLRERTGPGTSLAHAPDSGGKFETDGQVP